MVLRCLHICFCFVYRYTIISNCCKFCGIDERTDIQKSTVAAARLLCDLHRELGSWSLALMAYNCGAERVRKAQIRAGGTSDPWRVLPFLPAETRTYLCNQ